MYRSGVQLAAATIRRESGEIGEIGTPTLFPFGGGIGHPLIFCFFLAHSMSSSLEVVNEVNHGSATQQIRPGRTGRGLPLPNVVRRVVEDADGESLLARSFLLS